VDPPPDVRDEALGRMRASDAARVRYALERDLPVRTADGSPIALLCNVASDAEARIGLGAGAAGVGLLRTEIAFLDATDWPPEQAQREVLEPVFATLRGLPVTARLLDFSNDKVPPFLAGGPTGLDALLADRGALRAQLRALLEAGRGSELRVLVPMVRTARQVRAVRSELEAVAETLGWAAPPPLGVMIELPEAASNAADLAGSADFFSIGTNDLTSQVLGLDRADPGTGPALAADPRVLALIATVVAGAAEAGISVSVCGDAAADPAVLPLLIGLGIRTLSVGAALVPRVAGWIADADAGDCAEVAARALRASSAGEVWEQVRA
jgi:phosphoenolpyruvate-protein kinase (PTS system EI component)